MEENIPEILYHYCSADTFYKIIKGKSFWLSDITKSNDSQELKWVFTRFKEEFTSAYMQRNGRAYNDAEFKMVMDYADNMLLKSYACCFSQDGDSLSQWRGYAADGTGLSLGIDAQSIYQTSTFSVVPQKVEYKKDIQDCFIVDRVNNLLDTELTKEHISDVLIDLLRNASIFKHDSFEPEKEYRFIYRTGLGKDGTLDYYYQERIKANNKTNSAENGKRPSINGYIELCLDQGFDSQGLTLSPLSVRKDNLVSYFELGFSEVKDTFVRKIIIGPKCRLTRDDILLFLHSRGYNLDAMIDNGFEILPSKSTYT